MTKSKYSFIFYNFMPVGIIHAYLKCFTIFVFWRHLICEFVSAAEDRFYFFFLFCPICTDKFLPGSFVLSHQMQPLALLTFSI